MLLERQTSIEPADHLALEQTLYREARLLDEERFDEWLALTCEDIVYRMALRSRRFRKDRSGDPPVGSGMIFDDGRARLKLRIDRLESGYVWAEDPVNFVRRIVSNVEILPSDEAGSATVHSVVTIHRNRIDNLTRTLIAGRTDQWRSTDGQWLLARREMMLDHGTVPDSNLNTFF